MFDPRSLRHSLGNYNGTQTAAGTTQADATLIIASHVLVASVTAGTGVILRNSEANHGWVVTNGDSANALNIYPPVGGKINSATVNLPLVLPAQKSAWFMAQDSLNYSTIF